MPHLAEILRPGAEAGHVEALDRVEVLLAGRDHRQELLVVGVVAVGEDVGRLVLRVAAQAPSARLSASGARSISDFSGRVRLKTMCRLSFSRGSSMSNRQKESPRSSDKRPRQDVGVRVARGAAAVDDLARRPASSASRSRC